MGKMPLAVLSIMTEEKRWEYYKCFDTIHAEWRGTFKVTLLYKRRDIEDILQIMLTTKDTFSEGVILKFRIFKF